MSKKLKIYDENYQYTRDGIDLSIKFDQELDAIISKYIEKYDRTEFEHLMVSELFVRFSYYAMKSRLAKVEDC